MKRRTTYAVVDAFTRTPFKGNPGAVCLLEDGDASDAWMQSVASEFNVSNTAFLWRAAPPPGAAGSALAAPRFHLRWFTPVSEVDLCGHCTLAASHFLFSSSLANCSLVEFVTRSGILTARKIHRRDSSESTNNENVEHFSIELDLPVASVFDCEPAEVPLIPTTLNGASVFGVKKTTAGDLLVELVSGNEVADIQPQFDELKRCAGRGVILTAPSPDGSRFDFFARFFCPKLGVNEDPVCGSVHCALAPYWREKLGKTNLLAYMASRRGGVLDLVLEEERQRIKIRGEAVTVMVGTLLV